jgi:hypothetical protein
MAETKKYYVIKPTTRARKKVSVGDVLDLSESQARPLRNGGFITVEKCVAEIVVELVKENELLKAKGVKNEPS